MRYQDSINLIRKITRRQQSLIDIKWNPPLGEWVRPNTNGTSKGDMRVGYGGLIGDNNGTWHGGFSKNIGSYDANITKLWGVLEGLKFAFNKGYKRLELHIDNKDISYVITNTCTLARSGRGLTQRIKSILDWEWEVRIDHVYREANAYKNTLANLSLYHKIGIRYYEDCPTRIIDLLFTDVLGGPTSHLIFVWLFFFWALCPLCVKIYFWIK